MAYLMVYTIKEVIETFLSQKERIKNPLFHDIGIIKIVVTYEER